jgi:arylsulfatase A-like enzyme
VLQRLSNISGVFCFAWAVFFFSAAQAELEAADLQLPPNVVLVLADDLGWQELGCDGNTFNQTPHLDALASRGVRFTQAVAAAPVCSPQRAALLTGLWPARLGITNVLGPRSQKHLPPARVTLAEVLRSQGYATGIVGKWHLSGYANHGAPEVGPAEQGFDEVMVAAEYGIGGGDYFHPYSFAPSIEARLPDEHLIDRCNLEAVDFVERHAGEPFFLYLSHYAVHRALRGRADLVAHYKSKPGAGQGSVAPHNNPHLAAQLAQIDEGIGQLVAELKKQGVLEKTIFIFTSDNGGESTVTTNGRLRAGKSTLYEGGLRVPLIFSGPGCQAGTICDSPVSGEDFFPTILALSETPLPEGLQVDGASFAGLLAGGTTPHRKIFYWHYPLSEPHFLGGASSGAIREGDWKLIEFFSDDGSELYNLALDAGEQEDRSKARPEVAARLKDALGEWRKRVGAKIVVHENTE